MSINGLTKKLFQKDFFVVKTQRTERTLGGGREKFCGIGNI